MSVSRNPDLFCSSRGIGLGDTPADILELTAALPLMDPPRLTAVRRVVSGAFTPKRVALLKDRIGAEAERIVDEFVERGGGDVVADFSRKLPIWTISEMLGVPESMREQLANSAEVLIAAEDHESEGRTDNGGTAALKAGMDLHRMARTLIKDRRLNPGDDILSALVHSELDGEPLSEQVLRNIFSLFITAGNDTTRNTTSHAFTLFSDNPDQWSRLVSGGDDVLGPAIEEMVRCATPVIRFGRTATADTVLGGVEIAEGDPVVMFYESANRDEAVFPDPQSFDITRSPNPHVAFGGGGVHFCLGASLARVELTALFSRLAERVASVEAGEPSYIVSDFFNGINAMPVRVVAR
ncbi:MAG TPA: cytochrome P450 [Acidimicrobiales bacterium]|nr:cytochrome P450 [Acidimicrobiales bacterium]